MEEEMLVSATCGCEHGLRCCACAAAIVSTACGPAVSSRTEHLPHVLQRPRTHFRRTIVQWISEGGSQQGHSKEMAQVAAVVPARFPPMCGARKYLKTIGAEGDCVSSAASLRVKSLLWNLRWRCGGDGLLHAHPPGRAMPAATSPWQQLLRTRTCCWSVGRPHCDTRANAGAMGCPKVAAGPNGEA